MKNLSKKTFIAIEVVLYVALNSGAQPARSKEICEYQGVTLRYLEHILQALVHSGVLKGVRGPKGGYVLASDRRKILLSDVYECMLEVESGDEEGEKSSSGLHEKVIMPLCCDLQENIKKYLSTKTIQDLCESAEEQGINDHTKSNSDFII